MGGPNPRRGSKSASGYGPGVQIHGGSKSAVTPVQSTYDVQYHCYHIFVATSLIREVATMSSSV